MEITIHNVKKIKALPIDHFDTFKSRAIVFESSDKETLVVKVFGKTEEDISLSAIKETLI